MEDSVKENVVSKVSIKPAVYTSTVTGDAVDTIGATSAKLVLTVGDIDLASGNETYKVKIQHCDTSDGTFADLVADADITADNQTLQIAVENLDTATAKRYLKAVVTLAGTTPSCPCSGVFELGGYQNSPAQ